jgi:hypothetical protein
MMLDAPFRTHIVDLHSRANIPPLSVYISNITDKFYSSSKHNKNKLIKNLGNYSAQSLTFKIKHKLPKKL